MDKMSEIELKITLIYNFHVILPYKPYNFT